MWIEKAGQIVCIFDLTNLNFYPLLWFLLLHFVWRWRCCKKEAQEKSPGRPTRPTTCTRSPHASGSDANSATAAVLGSSLISRFNWFLTFVEFSGILTSIWLCWMTVSLEVLYQDCSCSVGDCLILDQKRKRRANLDLCKIACGSCCLAGFFNWNGLPGSKRKIFSKRGSALPWHTRSVRSLAPPRAPSNRSEGDQELN